MIHVSWKNQKEKTRLLLGKEKNRYLRTCRHRHSQLDSMLQCVVVGYSVLPCIAMCCSVLQCTYVHAATSTSNRHQRPVQRHAPHLHTLQMRRICLRKSPTYLQKNTANETHMSAKEPYVSENEPCVSDAHTYMSVDFHFYMRPSISTYFESGGSEHIQSGKCMYA